MRGRRLIAIFVGMAGILLLAILGLLAVLNLNQQDNQTTQPPATIDVAPDGAVEGTVVAPAPTVAPDSALVEVVVAFQTVPRGWQMSESELSTDWRLATEVGPNVITRLEDAVGLYARTDIFQGETMTTDSLVRDPTLLGAEYGPSSLIPPGWVAMAVPMDRLSSVAYGVAPGDSVDIMISFLFARIDEEFQTYLQNSISFMMEVSVETEEGTQTQRTIFVVDPYGRFESLPNNDIAHIFPSEDQRPVAVSMILQNARVIQVGAWTPPPPAQGPTPSPEPVPETPTPSAGEVPTATPPPPDVLLLALPPQQQLILKYALEGNADIDFALRGVGDGQLYAVQNVDLNYLLQQFNIEIPPDYDHTTDVRVIPLSPTATPVLSQGEP